MDGDSGRSPARDSSFHAATEPREPISREKSRSVATRVHSVPGQGHELRSSAGPACHLTPRNWGSKRHLQRADEFRFHQDASRPGRAPGPSPKRAAMRANRRLDQRTDHLAALPSNWPAVPFREFRRQPRVSMRDTVRAAQRTSGLVPPAYFPLGHGEQNTYLKDHRPLAP